MIILFDFDGTLVDSVDVGILITNRLAIEFGFPAFDEATLRELKELGSREALKRSQIPIWKLPFLIRRFTQEMNRDIPNLKLFPEMKETLFELKARGHQLGIVSTNSVENIKEFLTIQNLSIFDFVSASYTLFGKSRLIRRILRQQTSTAREVFYVGDETRDIEAARNSSVTAIAAAWGLNSAQILAANQPDFLIYQPKELLTVLEQV